MTPDLSAPLQLLSHLAGKRVLIVGDVMLDAYFVGEAERLSPEAPVPVVRLTKERHLLGGAGNVARNVAALGGIPTLVGQTGQDAEAELLAGLLEKENINNALTTSRERRTIVKTRVLARHQQLLRMDREDSRPFSSKETENLLAALENCLPGHSVIVLSDYAKGLVSETFMTGLRRLMARCTPQPLLLVDPKPVNTRLYGGATILTPNTRETGECAGLPAGSREEILAAGQRILKLTGSAHLLTTLGPDGMALFSEGEVWHIPTVAQSVFDVTGAGDTVIATLALALAAGGDLLPSCMLANYAAGIVVASVGAATVPPAQLAEAIRTLPVPAISRWA